MKQRVKTIIDRLIDILFWLVISIAVVWFVGSLFLSCCTTRKTTVSEVIEVEDQTQINTQRDSAATASTYRKDSLHQLIAEHYEVRIRRVEYDTAKPPDSTGRPPVRVEELITVKAQKDTQTTAGSETQKADSVATSARDSTRNDVRTERESKSRTVEKKRPPWVWIIGIAVGVGILFLVYKVRKR